MPNRIQLLTDHVANQIAAGEVIERPASVVKELVENALDAGSTRIEIDIRHGGKNLIRITDNGIGMSYDDALLSLERHATSKISDVNDLLKIKSYGFRGEALPSIASICRFRMQTCERGAAVGTEIVIDGGKIVDVHEAGCPAGTMIEVRSIFAHVPARRKFLRGDATEWGHIDQLLRQMTLCQLQVDWIVRHNDAPVWHLPVTEKLEERAAAIFGRDWIAETLSFSFEKNGLHVHGLIGKPGISRGDRHEQFFFVNHRAVQHSSLHFGLIEGYQHSLIKGRYPVAILFLEMDPAKVDVNVHPSKREVRFHDANGIRAFIAEGVSLALKKDSVAPLQAQLEAPAPPQASGPAPRVTTHIQTGWLPEKPSLPNFLGQLTPSRSEGLQSSEEKNHPLKVVGTLLDLYIVAENEHGIVLIDPAAAHERILFESLLRQLEKELVISQALLLPVAIHLTPHQADIFHRHAEALRQLGLGVSDLGNKTVMLDALPPVIPLNDVEGFFRSVLADLEEGSEEGSRTKQVEMDVLAQIICRHAVRGSRSLKSTEVERLLIDLHKCDLPYTCPQGKPTMIMLSRSELARKFGKIS